MLAWDVSNGVSIETDRKCQYTKKIKWKNWLYVMIGFSFITFTVSCNVCGVDSWGGQYFFLNVLSYQIQIVWCNFLYYTPYRSTVGAGPKMPKLRRLSVELWKKTPAWKWRCPIMCRIKIYLKGSSRTRLLFIAS